MSQCVTFRPRPAFQTLRGGLGRFVVALEAALDGVSVRTGLPDCVRQAGEAAEAVGASLARRPVAARGHAAGLHLRTPGPCPPTASTA